MIGLLGIALTPVIISMILHPATKGRLLNRLEEIETYRAIQRPNHVLTNDMSNVLVLLHLLLRSFLVTPKNTLDVCFPFSVALSSLVLSSLLILCPTMLY